MRRPVIISRLALCLAVTLPLAACGDQTQIAQGEDYGPSPKLPDPKNPLLPTVNIAPAVRFAEGAKPKPADGMAVTAFAHGLDHPRTLHVLPNGDVLVAETNAPERPEQGKTIKRIVAEYVMGRAGARTPSANRITLLRDADGDGVAEVRSTFLDGLNSPFGMALVGTYFYVANTDGIMRFTYHPGDTRITTPGTRLAELPGGPLNHHWTKDLAASPDGRKLYATAGSNSNVGEHGMDQEVNRAAVIEIDRKSGATRVFASGLRNPNGPAWEPQTGKLWVVVNERDEIGSDLVPDYMTSVQDGGFYGWPYSYFGQNVDERIKPPRPDLVARAIKPDYALGNHTASLGLAFNTSDLFPAEMKGGAFVGQHGSWNRKPHSGYKVIFVPFKDGQPAGPPRDILTGFLNDKGEALGRPVGVAIDRRGGLLVADDVSNSVWRVTPSGREQAAR